MQFQAWCLSIPPFVNCKTVNDIDRLDALPVCCFKPMLKNHANEKWYTGSSCNCYPFYNVFARFACKYFLPDKTIIAMMHMEMVWTEKKITERCKYSCKCQCVWLYNVIVCMVCVCVYTWHGNHDIRSIFCASNKHTLQGHSMIFQTVLSLITIITAVFAAINLIAFLLLLRCVFYLSQ